MKEIAFKFLRQLKIITILKGFHMMQSLCTKMSQAGKLKGTPQKFQQKYNSGLIMIMPGFL